MAKKVRQRSYKAVNAGKEIEAMKCLMFHRIASSLYRFIASGAQLLTVGKNLVMGVCGTASGGQVTFIK